MASVTVAACPSRWRRRRARCASAKAGVSPVSDEDAMEVIEAEAGLRSQGLQRWRRVGRLDAAAGGGDDGRMPRTGFGGIVLGALAGAVAGRLGLGGRGEELDVLRPRQPRGAARAAVDAGGAHRIDELAVGSRVARQYLGPARILGDAVAGLGAGHAGGAWQPALSSCLCSRSRSSSSSLASSGLGFDCRARAAMPHSGACARIRAPASQFRSIQHHGR